jgi:hypothetical protein
LILDRVSSAATLINTLNTSIELKFLNLGTYYNDAHNTNYSYNVTNQTSITYNLTGLDIFYLYSITTVPAEPIEDVTIEEASETTRQIIFAAFALLGVLMLVIIVVGIIAILNGGSSTMLFNAAMSAIGIAIVIFVGYVVIQLLQNMI